MDETDTCINIQKIIAITRIRRESLDNFNKSLTLLNNSFPSSTNRSMHIPGVLIHLLLSIELIFKISK